MGADVVWPQPHEFTTEGKRRTGVRAMKAGDEIETRGFAGAVRSDQRDGLAFVDGKLRSCTARSPPNRLLRLRMTNASAIERRLPRIRRGRVHDAAIGFRKDADQPGWPPQDHGDEDQAINCQLHAADGRRRASFATAPKSLPARRRR